MPARDRRLRLRGRRSVEHRPPGKLAFASPKESYWLVIPIKQVCIESQALVTPRGDPSPILDPRFLTERRLRRVTNC